MLRDVTRSLIATACDSTSADADMGAAAQAFFNAIESASRDDANAALRLLGAHLDFENASRAAFLALVCGALVERGCDPLTIAQPVTERLASLLESSAALAKACVDLLPESEEQDEDPVAVFEKTREQIAPRMPQQHAAWEALEQFWRPAIAVFSVSAEARASARHLREVAAQISEYHEAGHWLCLMLAVLDDEPILAIEPRTTLGILGRISGVVVNFQLNVLLMDGFPRSGFLPRRRVRRRVVDIARGCGPQESNDIVTGVWDLYTWQAIHPELTLPTAAGWDSSDHWIWNEGTPDDIPVFEGRRVILLGPPSYRRTWKSQRMFDNLQAKLEIERKLRKDEVRNWLCRLAAANSAS